MEDAGQEKKKRAHQNVLLVQGVFRPRGNMKVSCNILIKVMTLAGLRIYRNAKVSVTIILKMEKLDMLFINQRLQIILGNKRKRKVKVYHLNPNYRSIFY